MPGRVAVASMIGGGPIGIRILFNFTIIFIINLVKTQEKPYQVLRGVVPYSLAFFWSSP